MVQRMSGPGGESATGLSREGVPQATLSRWLREAGRVGAMKEKREESPPGARVSKRPEDWTAEEKLKVVAEAVCLDDTELGVLLRREGCTKPSSRRGARRCSGRWTSLGERVRA